MRVRAIVTKAENGYAIVESRRTSACEGGHKHAEGCSVCSLMGSGGVISAKAKNPLGAKIGDTVEIETKTKTVLFYAMLVFMLPIAVMLISYCGAGLLDASELVSYAVAGTGFLLTFAFLGLYSKLRISKRYDAEIVEIIEKNEEN